MIDFVLERGAIELRDVADEIKQLSETLDQPLHENENRSPSHFNMNLSIPLIANSASLHNSKDHSLLLSNARDT